MDEEKKVPQHRRGHSSDLGKPGHSPRETSGKPDLSKLFEKLQEMKHADKNSTSLKKLQETLAYFIDQERILRNKVEKEASNTSPEKKVFRDGSTKEKKKYVLLPSSTSQPNFPPRTATSPQPHRRPSYELILHELASEIAALREFLTKRRTNKPLQKVASANKMIESAAEESSFTGAENSFLSEADTDTLEDFSDDDEHYETVTLFDWNNLFQAIYEQEDPFARENEWASISQDFLHNSLTYGKIIISEAFVPNKNKTLQPLPIQESTVNYPLQCYVHKGIYYKLMMDPCKPYANLHQAMALASNEMRVWRSILQCQVPGLSLPFMAQIDSQGFRLLAISEMPVGLHTIVYGSNDGGRTVHNDNTEFEKKIEEVAKQLNLKKHPVARQELYTSALTEGHLGLDGRFYVAGTGMAHLFPPETPASGVSPASICLLLRPEFVKKYATALSSDAFSKFASEAPENDEEVMNACRYLHNVTIPECAQWLDSQSEKITSNSDMELSTILHEHGINLRHLGSVRMHCKSPAVREVLLNEVLARAIKNRLRATLRQKTREVPPMLLTPVQYAVVDFLNMVFGKSVTSRIFWTTELVELVLKGFPNTLTRECAVELRNYGLALGGDPKDSEKEKDKPVHKDKDAKRKTKVKQKGAKDKSSKLKNKEKPFKEKEKEKAKEKERAEKDNKLGKASKDKSKEKESPKDREKGVKEKGGSGGGGGSKDNKDNKPAKGGGAGGKDNKDNKANVGRGGGEKDNKSAKQAPPKKGGGMSTNKQDAEEESSGSGIGAGGSGVGSVIRLGEEVVEPREEAETSSEDTTEDSRTEDTDTRTEEVEMSDYEDVEKENFVWGLGQGKEVDRANLFSRVLALSGVLLSVKAQQQFFDNPRSGLWLTYQDIVGLQTRVKYLNEKGEMVKVWM